MSKRKTLTLREKIFDMVWEYITKEINGDAMTYSLMDRVMRIVREEQRKKCRKCHEQVVENIKEREMDRLQLGK